MKLSATLIIGPLLSVGLCGQETWKGLHFGMTETEARASYQGTLQIEPDPKFEVADHFALSGHDQTLVEMPALAVLSFNSSKKLDSISLFVQSHFAAQTGNDAIGSSLAAIDRLNKGLVEKYGKPVADQGRCDLSARMIVYERNPSGIWTCDRMWRSDGQNINLLWVYEGGRLSWVRVRYKPLPKDL
jgi:hypothetical protein